MLGKLALQLLVHLLGFGHKHEARRHLVETMHDERPRGLRQQLPEAVEQRDSTLLAWHCGHAGRLVDDHYPRVVVHDVETLTVDRFSTWLGKRIALHIEPLQHEVEQGAALALAGRIVVAVVPHLAHRRAAIPELGHAHGLQVVAVGILQQLGRTALSRAGRRQPLAAVVAGKHVDQIFALTARVAHYKETEYALLQRLAHGLAPLLELRHAALVLLEPGTLGINLPCTGALNALELGLLVLALGNERLLLLRREAAAVAHGIAQLLGGPHGAFPLRHVDTALRLKLLDAALAGSGLPVVLELSNDVIEVGDRGLAAPELAPGLQQVVDGRHKVVPIVAVTQVAREGGQITQPVVASHHQHAQHLACLQLMAPLDTGGHVAHHLAGGNHSQRVGYIVKRKSELRGQLDAAHAGVKPMYPVIAHWIKHVKKSHRCRFP